MAFDQNYWEGRYVEGSTGWDTSGPTRPLTDYIDQIENRELKILIPGAGNAYEAEYLFQHGFKGVYVLDVASHPLENVKNRIPDFPENQLIQEDFFDHQGTYDLILEQTFFCAIDPSHRNKYVTKTSELLKTGGKLVGVLWSQHMNDNQPPFGGSIQDYEALFKNHFKINVLAPCHNSIKPRRGMEVFIDFEKC